MSASASSGLAVSFEAIGDCSVSGDIVTLVGAGECSVVAHQPGSTAWHPAPSVVQNFAIARGSQDVTLEDPGLQAFGADLTVPLAFSASSGLPVRLVIVDDNACSAVEGNSVVITSPGNCGVKAVQDGNDDFLPAESATVNFEIYSTSGVFVWDDDLPDWTYPPGASFEISATVFVGSYVYFWVDSSPSICTVESSDAANPMTLPLYEVPSVATSAGVSPATVTVVGPGTCTIVGMQHTDQDYNGGDFVTKSFEIVSSGSSPTPTAP